MTVRIAAKVWINALSRRIAAEGGFLTVIHHGDDAAGAVLLLLRDRDGSIRALTRVVHPGGGTAWQVGVRAIASDMSAVSDHVARQRRFDSDLWVVELDIADPERFIDEPVFDT